MARVIAGKRVVIGLCLRETDEIPVETMTATLVPPSCFHGRCRLLQPAKAADQ
ncbi:MAG: hypothetical protein K8H87_11480 [Pseudorhodoplanes sp.]|nr:hypothetical protein [Pseudorhodoplanes sp.]